MARKRAASSSARSRKKLRKNASSASGSGSVDETHHSSSEEEDVAKSKFSTAATLKDISSSRNLKHKSRLRTVTSSFDATFRHDLSSENRDAILRTIDHDATALGILRHLVFVYMADLADKEPGNENIFNRTFIQQLFDILSGQSSNAKSPISFPHLHTYLATYVVPDGAKELVKDFGKRPRDAICGEIMTAIEEAVSGNFQGRATAHIVCALEKCVWSQRNICDSRSSLVKTLEKLATVIFVACAESSEQVARQKVNDFCDRTRGPAENRHNLSVWKQLVVPLLHNFYQVFEPLRQPLTQEELEKRKKNLTDVQLFFYNVKKRKTEVLILLSQFRSDNEELRQRKEQLRDHVNEFQPVIKFSTEKRVFKNQEYLLRQVPIPSWLSSDAEMSKENAKTLVSKVKRVRLEEWTRREQPGMETVPPSYTLLPTFKLQKAFVTYDSRSIVNLIKRSNLSVKTPPRRKWWTGIFDFHTRKRITRPISSSSSGILVDSDSPHSKRKLLKLKKNLQTGIHLCVRDPWVVTDDDEEYERNLKSATVRAPYMVNSIKTDGLQVKVLLSTVAPEKKTVLAASRLPHGISELDEKGYYKIQGTYEVEKHSTGVFKKAKQVPQSKQVEDLEVVGLDPGQVQIFTTSRAQSSIPVSNTRTPRTFNDLQFQVSHVFSAHKYRFEGLARHSEKKEAARRIGAYGEAIDNLNSVSLKVQGQSEAYVNVLYENLLAMVNELLTSERRSQRFARFRARQRVMHHMASTAVYGEKVVPEKDIRPIAERGMNKTEAVQKEISKRRMERRKEWTNHKDKRRIVFFGAATFGHGRHGPCPRKPLLRSIGLLAPVVLVHEYNTSKCCRGCGTVLEQIGGSRQFRCPKSQAEGVPCSVDIIDRDVNGASNIAVCGTRQLFGLHRPDFLRRRQDDDPEDYFKF